MSEGAAVMDVMNFTETRANLKDVMDRVVQDHAPVVVARQRAEAVVLVSLSDWQALEESSHLLSSPTNRQRLADAIAELDRGEGLERTLIDR